jgi:hypothetical protein
MPFHLLETYIRNPSLFFISFFTLPPRGKRRWQQDTRAHICAWGGEFCQVGLPNCWRAIFLVLPKLDECQVDLPNYWSCSSPRVCQNLLGQSCVLQPSKKLCKIKKRIHLQQFGIIHLPNPDLTYIRNPEKNKIMYVPFHLLKNLHQESFSILYFFFTLPPRGKQQ